MKLLDNIVLTLIILGSINWGLIGIFQFDLISNIFGYMSVFSRIIYSIIGVSALYAISFFIKNKNNTK
ncbi:Domain of uncharacterised function (DUF378) [uncultured Clostridium sp.]|uniref:DUF378 domain-containing protein n=1 Tax=uncultured Clostridium sp. TaxID=59620 RepID=UPI0008230864|nr:DUF378 domain-containing protein [uncultured Clostridium sp.]SCJ96993.1 Domain of uncharacterised function (DUF378) [uncultured Clostridium sp.]